MKPYCVTWLTAIFVAGLQLGLPVNAQTNSSKTLETSDSMPCSPELCLGDGLSKLAQINFDVARANPTSPYNGSYGYGMFLKETLLTSKDPSIPRELVQGPIHRGDKKALADANLYLVNGRFDNKSIPLLEKVPAACQMWELKARYISGNKKQIVNIVKIALVPDADDVSKQSWMVTGLERYWPPGNMNNENKNKWVDLLKESYPTTLGLEGIPFMKSNGRVDFSAPNGGNPKLYFLFTGRKMEKRMSQNSYRSHPLCNSAVPGL